MEAMRLLYTARPMRPGAGYGFAGAVLKLQAVTIKLDG
jgi:hypothetical protein